MRNKGGKRPSAFRSVQARLVTLWALILMAIIGLALAVDAIWASIWAS